jgi:hypothetical protein
MQPLQVKAQEYRRRAEELRDLATHIISPEFREQFLEVATEWERLAKFVENIPEDRR